MVLTKLNYNSYAVVDGWLCLQNNLVAGREELLENGDVLVSSYVSFSSWRKIYHQPGCSDLFLLISRRFVHHYFRRYVRHFISRISLNRSHNCLLISPAFQFHFGHRVYPTNFNAQLPDTRNNPIALATIFSASS